MQDKPIRIFAGYDPRERVGYHVFSHSVIRRATQPVSITPIALRHLGGLYWRERNPNQSTDFSISRFLTAKLAGYQGWCIWADGSDMLCLDDIAKLYAMRDNRYAVMVVKHDYEVKDKTKFLGAKQTVYPRKNWSSLMLINASRWLSVGVMEVNTMDPVALHRFKMFRDEDIGELPAGWNHIPVDNPPNPDANLVHFSRGLPAWDAYSDDEHAEKWFAELDDMNYIEGAM